MSAKSATVPGERENPMEYLTLIRDLIRTRPVSADVEAVNRASETMFDFLRQKGLFCTRESLNGRTVVYASVQEEKTPELLLNAHLDVVPPSEDGQFEPVIRDGWITGRGAGDCIGNAVCIAKALCGLDKHVSAGAVFSTDEETGGKTSRYMVEQGYGARKMICVMDHWDNDQITYAQKGTLGLQITAHGKGGHSSTPWLADNPVDKLIEGYMRLKKLWHNPTAEESWKKSMAATVLQGSPVVNQIPESASMRLHFRLVREEERQEIIDLVKKVTGLEVTVTGGGALRWRWTAINRNCSSLLRSSESTPGKRRGLPGCTGPPMPAGSCLAMFPLPCSGSNTRDCMPEGSGQRSHPLKRMLAF